MTYGIVNVLGVLQQHKGKLPLKGILFNPKWSDWTKFLYNLIIGCHLKHSLDFSVAFIFYIFFFPSIIEQAHQLHLNWILKVVFFNLFVEFTLVGFWHWFTYCQHYSSLSKTKYNSKNQYEENGNVRLFRSSSGNLEREIFLTTLGYLQSSAFQCVMMYLWGSGILPYRKLFFENPIYNIATVLFVSYWREFHFYWCHRMIHPWWHRDNGLAQGDIGAFLYRHFHSLHHKSYNPGPWAGLSMHPVEHFFYYTCTLLPLFFSLHPLHFLYAKFHADISPIGGHDGFPAPGGGSAYHWLHHAKFECNYGVPLVNFDALFGTKLDYEDYLKEKAKNK
jgi:sterol desaturase/sphingolipid hydroxylase (fatty acid hydroxylase superfamily)